MKFFVKSCGEIPTYLLVEWAWNEVHRRRLAQYWWVLSPSEATPFCSDKDAWANFDRSKTGSREDFALEALA